MYISLHELTVNECKHFTQVLETEDGYIVFSVNEGMLVRIEDNRIEKNRPLRQYMEDEQVQKRLVLLKRLSEELMYIQTISPDLMELMLPVHLQVHTHSLFVIEFSFDVCDVVFRYDEVKESLACCYGDIVYYTNELFSPQTHFVLTTYMENRMKAILREHPSYLCVS